MTINIVGDAGVSRSCRYPRTNLTAPIDSRLHNDSRQDARHEVAREFLRSLSRHDHDLADKFAHIFQKPYALASFAGKMIGRKSSSQISNPAGSGGRL